MPVIRVHDGRGVSRVSQTQRVAKLMSCNGEQTVTWNAATEDGLLGHWTGRLPEHPEKGVIFGHTHLMMSQEGVESANMQRLGQVQSENGVDWFCYGFWFEQHVSCGVQQVFRYVYTYLVGVTQSAAKCN